MRNYGKQILAVGVAILTVAAIVRAVSQARGKDISDQKAKNEVTAQAASHISVRKGETVITLSARTQRQVGIAVETLGPHTMREGIRALAVVLPAQGLIGLRAGMVAAQARVAKARAALDVSQKEYSRIKTLYGEDQNASEKSMDAAGAALAASQADLQAAEQDLALQQSTAQQSWGGVVAGWLVENSGSLRDVLSQRNYLLRVILPSGAAFVSPHVLTFEIPGAGTEEARFVSALPQIDPRIQGISLLYLARASRALAPGRSLSAQLSVGPERKGVVVPESAVVWWQGSAWAYIETGEGRFIRRRVPTDIPELGGWFVRRGFAPGEKIVVTGAQMMFSEEFRPQTQTQEEEKED